MTGVIVTEVLPKTASFLLPRFQALLTSWPVDSDRLANNPGIPDVGVYLRQYTETNVETNRVSLETAQAELEAGEKLASPEFFAKYANLTGGGLTGLSYEALRTVNMEPTSKESKKILFNLSLKDNIEGRMRTYKKLGYVFLALVAVLFTASATNAVIRSGNINQEVTS